MADTMINQPWQADLQGAQRRRQLAQALMGNVMAPAQGQMIGRYYVGDGIGAGIAKLGQALLARSYNRSADETEQNALAAKQAAQEKAMTDFTGAISGQPELDPSSIGDVINGGSLRYTSGKPSNRDLGMALLKARNAGLDVDKDTAQLLMGDNAPIEALGVVQTDENGNVWNLNKRGQWNQAPFQAGLTPKEKERLNREDRRFNATLNKPTLVQTDNGFEWVRPGQLPAGKPKSAAGGAPTDGENKAAASTLIMDNALNDFEAATGAAGAMSDRGYIASKVPLVGQFFVPEPDQKAKAAMTDWYREKLRLESGATIGDNEAYEEAKRYFPVPGDDKGTIEQKARAREVVMQGLRLKAGRAGAAAPADGKPGSTAKQLPATNAKGWVLMTDANGNRAYVGPNNQIEEVR